MLPDRFWKKVDKNGPIPAHAPHLGPCHLWLAGLQGRGYGAFHLNGRMHYAHVVAFEDVHGPVPKGHELDHLCRVHACCNDTHVEPVTHQENVRRGRLGEVSGARERTKTRCPKGHPYDEKNTAFRARDGRRVCRACNRAHVKASRGR
jgi:hypothetical protein